MALLVPALALLLALPPLLSAQGAGQASSNRRGESKTPEKCKAPDTGDSRVQFDPKQQQFYSPGDSVTWRCPAGYRPSPPEIRCTRTGSQSVWSGTAACTGVCTTTAGDWPPSVSAVSARTEFAVGERVSVTCRPEQYGGSPAWIQCTEKAGRVAWDMSRVRCIEKCPRPQWDARLRFEPDRPFYGQNERTVLSCPQGSRPSLSVITCVRRDQNSDSRNTWAVRDIQGTWRRLTETVTCVEIPQIIPGDLEVSPTTIELRWTCSPAESCQGRWKIQAGCQPDGSSSGPCPKPARTKEQTLQGLQGTLTCSSLQPFTSYSVTISGVYPATSPARTVLYSQRVSTSETAPDTPETEPPDLTTRTLSWKELLPCQGAIVGYQLNITAWREYDSSFREGEVLRVNPSVTKYQLRSWKHGTNYTVTIQGLTAAGPGQASRWDFETEISDTCRRGGGWTTKVMFPSAQTAFRVNDTVLVTCHEDRDAGQFPANCTELKDRGAVWDISGVKCLRMCNDWAKQVDFVPSQPEFGAGTQVQVTCRQQFQQHSFSVTCREAASGRFEWDFGDHKCVREARRDLPGGAAVAVAVPVVLVVLATGALLLSCVCFRKRKALASRPAKDAGEALYTELQPRDDLDIYCTVQT